MKRLSQIVLAPEEKLGIIILTNGEAGETFSSISWHVLDHYLGALPRTTSPLSTSPRPRRRETESHGLPCPSRTTQAPTTTLGTATRR